MPDCGNKTTPRAHTSTSTADQALLHDSQRGYCKGIHGDTFDVSLAEDIPFPEGCYSRGQPFAAEPHMYAPRLPILSLVA